MVAVAAVAAEVVVADPAAHRARTLGHAQAPADNRPVAAGVAEAAAEAAAAAE